MDLALLVHACDKYSFVFERFLKSFDNFNLNIPCYFSTESTEIKNKRFQNININEDIWSTRLKQSLLKIKETNIILIQEDFIINNFNKDLFLDLYKFHNDYNSDITKTGSFKTFSLLKTSIKNIYAQKHGYYLMSHQPIAIFNKQFLMSTLNEKQNASEHEMYWSERIQENNIFCFGKNDFDHQMFNPIFGYKHVISKGKLID
ncbi:hypothetical protein EBU24_00325 [bacterium]|nr:hypothetical protein [bacterium]